VGGVAAKVRAAGIGSSSGPLTEDRKEILHEPRIAAGQYAAVLQALKAGPASAWQVRTRAQDAGNPLSVSTALDCLLELAAQGRVVRVGRWAWQVVA
jgi:hypothetical protein